MQPFTPDAGLFPTPVFDPDVRFLDAIHRATPRSWVVVASAIVNETMKKLVYRHGADALVESPVDVPQLAERISSLQARSRPLF